jgi:hypothetical protein
LEWTACQRRTAAKPLRPRSRRDPLAS